MRSYLPFLCISASAGSGKTFQLSRRVLRLLAMQAEPDSIAAYTFSRKAAGEIFDSIVAALCEAASSDEQAAETSQVMGMAHSRQAFINDLRRWFHSLHRLRIGTLDSRISQMLSAVSVELGLPPEFSLMDTQSAEYLRVQGQVLNRMFNSGALTEELAKSFLQLFSEATHGKAEKNFTRLMENFLENHRGTFLIYPEKEAWEGPEISDPPQILDDLQCEEHWKYLQKAIPDMGFATAPASSLLKFAEACSAFRMSSTWSGDVPDDTLSTRLLEGDGPVVLYRRKEMDLSPVWEPLQALVNHVLAVSLSQVRQETRALYGFLSVYQLAYQGEALPGGQLAFEDACMLMSDFDQLEPHELAYRLDGEISHWLLDEFQDTNRLQWKVLEPFIAEVLQDPEAQRSFFYVGDVKQAIYGWRGGDSELFGQVLRDWPLIQRETMAVSYRSAPPVLDLVNRVFNDLPCEEALAPQAIERWNQEFEPHRAANPDLPGHARVWQLEDTETDPNQVILDRVRELPPQAETAILVRTNDQGREIADVLRGGGFRVSLEGSSPLQDDTAVEVVLAVLKQAAHPLDEFSPKLMKLAGVESHPQEILDQLQREGFTSVLRDVIDSLPLEEEAAFSKGRLQRLLQLGIDFDRFGDPSVDRFLAFVEKARPKGAEARGVIRIMTVHQSKGLGFDAVILPLVSSSSFCKIDSDALVTSAADAERPCVSLIPPKAVCERIPEFREMRERLEAEKTYESLCGLYVALTRAKQSLQILLPVPPKSEGSMGRIENWLAKRIGEEDVALSLPGVRCLCAYGAEGWECGLKERSAEETAPVPFRVGGGRKTLSRLEPSRESSQPQKMDQFFQLYERDGRELGSRVHALLEKVEWADELNPLEFLKAQGEGADSEAARHFCRVIGMSEMRKPDGATGLWREQRFETVLKEGWVTGIFDRVVLFEDGAWIQDFKTNQTVSEVTVLNYTPQMKLYRRVLSDMLGFEEEKIRCQLLFTKTGEMVGV